jgi:transposase
VISGMVHVLKSGGRWVDAPAGYGPRKTLYNRFVRWAAKGVWADIFHALASAGGGSVRGRGVISGDFGGGFSAACDGGAGVVTAVGG